MSINLPFLDLSHEWNHTTHGVFCVASFSKHGFEVCPYSDMYHSSFLLLLNSILLYGCGSDSLSIQADGHLGSFHFLAIRNAALIFPCWSLWRHKFSFLLGRYLGVELLCCMVNLCLTIFLKNAELFSKVALPFYLIIIRYEGFYFFPSLPSHGYYLSFGL